MAGLPEFFQKHIDKVIRMCYLIRVRENALTEDSRCRKT